MSKFERQRRRISQRELRRTIFASVKAQGCTCDPIIDVEGDIGPGEVRMQPVKHDDWCALLARVEGRGNN